MTSSEIESATFRFVAQHLNHCATAVPPKNVWNAKLLYLPTSINMQCHKNTNSASTLDTCEDEAEDKPQTC